jgi:Domain of unknown function (DUF4383)
MAHYPLNHHLRPLYRFLAAVAGLYLLAFGVVGIAATWGDPFLHRGADWALGLRTNPAASWLGALVGLVVLGAALVGGNLLHRVSLVLGYGICAFAMVVMTMIQTDANVLNVSMVNVIVLVLIGLIVLVAGLYGKVGSADASRAEAAAAHGPR